MHDFVFIPNSFIKKYDGEYAFLNHDIDFISTVKSSMKAVSIVGHFESVEDLGASRVLDSMEGLDFQGVSIQGKKSRFKQLWVYMQTFMLLIKVAAKRPKFVYIYYPGLVPLMAGYVFAFLKVPFGLYVRGDWEYHPLFRKRSGYLFKRAEFVIATGVGFVEKIAIGKKPAEPVVPMVNIDLQDPTQIRGSSRKPGEKINVLYVGRVVREKGLYDCLDAFHIDSDLRCKARLSIVGMGFDEDLEDLGRMIQELNLHGCVEYLGQINNKKRLSEIFSNSHVFLFPSYYPEGFPRVVYEAMLSRLAVVCTVLPGMKGFMKPNINCIEVKKRAPRCIVEALRLLESDESMRVRIASNGYKDVTEYLSGFTSISHADQVLKHIKAL